MDNNKKKKSAEQEKINELAKKYYYAERGSQKIRYLNELCSMIFGEMKLETDRDGSFYKGGSLIYQELKNKAKNHAADVGEIPSLVVDLVYKFDYTKNDNFCAFLIQNMEYKFKDIYKQKKKTLAELENNTCRYEEEECSVIDNAKDETDIAQNVEKSDSARNFRCKYTTVVTNFILHASGKKASDVRKNYYRIFFTEHIMSLIYETGNTDGFNNNEVYETSDKDFVEYITDIKYRCVDSLINSNLKMISELVDDYHGEDKVVSLPCENCVIVNYRYRYGLDDKKVSEANVSQQRSKYSEFLMSALKDLV